jgi:hypothetical protein
MSIFPFSRANSLTPSSTQPARLLEKIRVAKRDHALKELEELGIKRDHFVGAAFDVKDFCLVKISIAGSFVISWSL